MHALAALQSLPGCDSGTVQRNSLLQELAKRIAESLLFPAKSQRIRKRT